MFSLKDVSDAILALQTYASKPDADKEVVYRRNKDLFYLLMQQEEFFIVAANPDITEQQIQEKTFLPYIATIKGNGDKRYLRLFSHIEAAKDFVRQCELPDSCCVKVSALETMKLARYWVQKGVYGYILNDSQPWATISFAEYLQIVFKELLEREDGFSDECAALLDIAVGIRSGDTSWSVIDSDDEVKIQKGQGDILRYEVLRGIAQEDKKLQLEWQGTVIESSTGALKQVLLSLPEKKVCPSCKSVIEFYDCICPCCGQVIGNHQDYDFGSITDVGLSFTTLTPALEHPADESLPQKTSRINPLNGYKKFANAVNSLVGRLTGKPVVAKTDEAGSVFGESQNPSDSIHVEDPDAGGRKTSYQLKGLFRRSRRTQSNDEDSDKEGRKTSPSMDKDDAAGRKTQSQKMRYHSEERQEKRKPFSAQRAIQLGVLVIVVAFMGYVGKQAIVLHEFSGVLNEGAVTEAKAIYDQKIHNGLVKNRADGKVIGYIDELMADYANNQINASYANTKLKECEVFDAEADYLKSSYQKAAQLEVSKNSYVSGKSYFEQGNYLQGLSDWLFVIPQDENNYESVKAIVEKYGTEYKLHGLLQCADYKNEGDTERYQKGLDVLLQWFPNDQDILDEKEKKPGEGFTEPTGSGSIKNSTDKGNRFSPYYIPGTSGSNLVDSSPTASTPVGDYPIEISKISASLPNGQGGRDLCIKWINMSGKTINKITFTVESVNGMGKPVTCGRGGYSIYRATAIGPFDHGKGMDGSIVWESAWYNSTIEKVNLIGITIEYTDGKIEEIDKSEDLKSIFV